MYSYSLWVNHVGIHFIKVPVDEPVAPIFLKLKDVPVPFQQRFGRHVLPCVVLVGLHKDYPKLNTIEIDGLQYIKLAALNIETKRSQSVVAAASSGTAR